MSKQNRYRRVVTPAPKRKPNATLTIGGKSWNVENVKITSIEDDARYCDNEKFAAFMHGATEMNFTMDIPIEPVWRPLPEQLYDEVREDYETGELYVEIDGERYRCRVHEPDEPEREYDFDPPRDWTPEDD